MQHPQKIETVHVETLDGELCIYDWQRLEVHALNPTAATVWQLCDGQTSPQEMAGQLKGDLTPVQAEELVWLTLKRLEKANLLDKRAEVVKPAGRKVLTRREMLVRLGVAATLLPVVSSIVAPGPVEAQSSVTSGSQTFTFTGAEQTFTVRDGVTAVTIEAFGAQGWYGASGGRTVATINVTPGETLYVNVGGQGGNPTGGFNGGGDGGGASDVRQGGNELPQRVIVAGGGGGTGISNGGGGGAGGGLTGAAGQPGGSTDDGSGGEGGSQTGGGAGGTGHGGVDGAAGVLGAGGSGGSDSLGSQCGGGGGGGYYGGGGGEAGYVDNNGNTYYGGGGGGSSYTIPGATGVIHEQGVRTGDGQVTISW